MTTFEPVYSPRFINEYHTVIQARLNVKSRDSVGVTYISLVGRALV
jgi:hypothetical protein